MSPILYLTESIELEKFSNTDFIVEPSMLSRFGKLDLDKTNKLSQKAKALGHKVYLEWDILMVEKDFVQAINFFKKIELDNFDAIRVQDPGAINWCLENTNHNLHLNLETGNHNFPGIKSWLDKGKNRISRIILSIEWSKSQLSELLPKLECPVEFLGMGRILLFYTPRFLLNIGLSNRESTLEMGNTNHWLEAAGQSEESPHKGFPLLENRHGTYMFLPSDHCLLDHLKDLSEVGISNLRIDNRFMSDELLNLVLEQVKTPSEEGYLKIKENSESRLIRGFYNTNKSDVLFKKLKNHRIQRRDENYLGQVLDVNKKNYLAIKLKNPKKNLELGDQLSLQTPDGKTKYLTVNWLKDCAGNDKKTASGEDLVFVNHVGGVSVRASVYFSYE
ncbi:MAG: hypothetical protein CME70_16180 [Halobacteriovorax sp.]|nr:hypothetical protein [Halobacteriovorax sp.]|tara:strand:- start:104631 stop:105800 length:1170 start_codon:yes stop_codon:yes gene_type:complete